VLTSSRSSARAICRWRVSTGTPGVHRKPTIQVIDRQGRTLGYAKVGWSQETIRLVRHEAAVLRALDGIHFMRASVPRVVHAGPCGALYVLAEQPLERPRATPCRDLCGAHLRFLAELAAACPEAAAADGFDWPIDALDARGFHYYGHLLAQARAWCERETGSARLPAAFAHGDFTPWNVRVDRSGLAVFDWEYAREGRAIGWDVFHFLVATGLELKRQSARDLYRGVLTRGPGRDRIEAHFAAMGYSGGLIDPCFVAYLSEALAQNVLRDGRRPSRQDAQLRRVGSELLNLVLHAGAQHARSAT